MIDFQRPCLSDKASYDRYLQKLDKGCEYSFSNLYLWGRQKGAFHGDFLVLFSQFDRKTVYPFPVGTGELKPVLNALIQDARDRGIPFRITSMTLDECRKLASLYPGKFRYHQDRAGFDYVYAISDLATLKGRKLQKKRNHLNRFRQAHPDCQVLPLTPENVDLARDLAARWYEQKLLADPAADIHLERTALTRALNHFSQLEMEGLLLMEDGQVLAMTLGSRLNADTFDIHFEKAREDVDGAYTAVNQAFAQYLLEKYPELLWLNREDDLGLEGLRKAKLSYQPHHLVEKYWARLWEEDDEDQLS